MWLMDCWDSFSLGALHTFYTLLPKENILYKNRSTICSVVLIGIGNYRLHRPESVEIQIILRYNTKLNMHLPSMHSFTDS